MHSAPTPLHPDPKTIFEWFLNVYYWYEEHEDSTTTKAARKQATMQAWCKFRRESPDILKTKDKKKILKWIPEEWERTHGRQGILIDIMHLYDDPDKEEPTEEEEEEEEPPIVKEEVKPEEVAPEEEGDGDDEEVEVICKEKYFDSYWISELNLHVEDWSVEDVRDFITTLSRSAKAGAQPRYAAIAKSCYISDIDGKLLEAGGQELIVTKTVGVKWEASLIRYDAGRIMRCLEEHKTKNSATYYKRSKALQHIYCGSTLEPIVKDILQPQPLDDILYTHIFSRVSAESCAITSLNEDVSKTCVDKAYRYKVVSVSPHETPLEVHHNLIYYKNASSHWVLLFSVDFMKHGEGAPSGHWHINRAPLGELIPHWGPSNAVFHGTPDSCPIWWQLIPCSTSYYYVPERNPLRSWVA